MTSLCGHRIKKYYRYMTSRCNLVFPTASNIPFKFSRCLFEHWTFLDQFFHCMPQKDPVKGHFLFCLMLDPQEDCHTKEKNYPAVRWLNSRWLLENLQPDLGQKSFSEALLNSPPSLLSTALVFVKINYSFIHLLVMLNRRRIPLSAHL